jgi:transposase
VFIDVEGRSGRLWWLWQSSTPQACVFFLDPTRSFDAPSEYLKDTPEDSVVCADRYVVYKKLRQAVAFCWAHVRRDFVRIGRSQRCNLGWALRWLNRIKRLYRSNRKRVEVRDDPKSFAAAQDVVVAVLDEIRRECDRELALGNGGTGESRRKALESLQTHWDGLTRFLTDPDIPLDTNLADRLFRPVANFRKNCFGVHSRNFGEITALLLSIFATLRLNAVAPRLFLVEYFAAVAQAGGDAKRVVKDFLPWDLPAERRQRLVRAPERTNTS